MRKSPKYSPEVIERAVRMVFDAKDQYLLRDGIAIPTIQHVAPDADGHALVIQRSAGPQ